MSSLACTLHRKKKKKTELPVDRYSGIADVLDARLTVHFAERGKRRINRGIKGRSNPDTAELFNGMTDKWRVNNMRVKMRV